MQATNVQLPAGMSLRPSRPADSGFLETLFNSTRDDLRYVDGEADFVESLIEMQQRAQTQGFGDMFPNAMYFIVEMHQERIGRVVLNFSETTIDILDISLIRPARGKGYTLGVIRGLQATAAKVNAPLFITLSIANTALKSLYLSVGFTVEWGYGMAERLVWTPNRPLA